MQIFNFNDNMLKQTQRFEAFVHLADSVKLLESSIFL